MKVINDTCWVSLQESLGFGLFVGQKKQFEDVTSALGNVMSIFHNFLTFDWLND